MYPRKLTLLACALALALSGCATHPERSDGVSGDFAAARKAYLAGDFDHALPLMQKEADAGNAHAQYTLGYMLFHGLGVVPNREEGLRWIRSAAARGEPRALEALGRLAASATKAQEQQQPAE